jgi:choline dehydrogenase-like flavoprotein
MRVRCTSPAAPARTRSSTRSSQAGVNAGYGATEDYNGQRQEGFGAFEMTVWQGERWSAAKAYLRPAIATGRCTVASGLVEKVEIENGRATGVRLLGGPDHPRAGRGHPLGRFDQFAQNSHAQWNWTRQASG